VSKKEYTTDENINVTVGGVSVGVEPKVIHASNPNFKIYLKSTENKDDVVEIFIDSFVNKTIIVNINAGGELVIPINISNLTYNLTEIEKIMIVAKSRNLNSSSSTTLLVLGGG